MQISADSGGSIQPGILYVESNRVSLKTSKDLELRAISGQIMVLYIILIMVIVAIVVILINNFSKFYKHLVFSIKIPYSSVQGVLTGTVESDHPGTYVSFSIRFSFLSPFLFSRLIFPPYMLRLCVLGHHSTGFGLLKPMPARLKNLKT